MSRLIDADALKAEMRGSYDYNGSPCFVVDVKDIDDAPTVDAVRVVRCEECKWWFKDENYDGLYRCANDGLLRKGDHYCADGERKDERVE